MRRPARSAAARLTTARLEFSQDRRRAQALLLLAVTAVVVASGAIAWQAYAERRASDSALASLTQQNDALRTELARTRAELELERSSHAALARQVAELNEEKIELARRLAFFNAQDARQGRAR